MRHLQGGSSVIRKLAIFPLLLSSLAFAQDQPFGTGGDRLGINVQNNGVTIITRYYGLLHLNCTGGLNCTSNGNTVTLNASGGNAFISGVAGTGYQDVTEIAAPSNPASGNDRLYLDLATHTFKCLTSSGTSCNGTAVLSGLTTLFIPVATSSSTIGNSLLQDSGTQLSYPGTGGFNLSGTGIPTWVGTFGATPASPSGTQSAITFGTAGKIFASFAGDTYMGLVRETLINGAWITAGTVPYAAMDTSNFNLNFPQVGNMSDGGAASSGEIAVSGAADLATAANGTYPCMNGSGVLKVTGCPAGSGGAAANLSNLTNPTAINLTTLTFAGAAGITTTSNGNFTVATGTTGASLFGNTTQSCASPAFGFSTDSSGASGFANTANGVWHYCIGGTPVLSFASSTGLKNKSANSYCWSQTSNSSGSPYACINLGSTSIPGIVAASTSSTGATGAYQARQYLSETNCSSAASPAVCGTATQGSVVVAAGATTVVVNTSSVTANSQIQLTFDASLGTKLSVTCNTSPSLSWVSARSASTSFTITTTAPVTNPACLSYSIFN